MQRRDFLRITGMASLAVGLGACNLKSSSEFKNYVWVRGIGEGTEPEIRAFLERLRKNNIHGLIPSGGNERYEKLAPLCKEYGLELHAWRWTMNRGGYMKDHPEWYAVSRNGDSVVDKPPYVGYYRWLCPSRPEVTDLLVKDYTTLCDIDGLTGVHLDYVRYCDVILPEALQPKYNLVQDHEMPEFDFCYCPVCREKFKAQFGTDPLDLPDPTKSKEWRQFRLDQLVKVVNTVADAVHKKDKKISAAVFPTPSIARRIVRQDWERFDLDAFFPMIYFKDYYGDMEWVKNTVQEGVQALKPNQKLYAGLHVGHLREEFGLQKVVQSCLENGANGVCFFMGTMMKEEEWQNFMDTYAKWQNK